MDTSNIEETTPLFSRYDVPTAIRDIRRPYQKQLAVYLIVASTLFERLAFYSLVTSLVLNLGPDGQFHWSDQHSQAALFIFSGTSYISTLIFAVISDAKLGRARTIIIGFVLYLTGYTLVTIVATGTTSLCSFNATLHYNATTIGDETCALPILGTLICIAIGAGAVKSNMAVFGAEQIQESKITSRYFDKYVLAVNTGSMVATLVIPYIQNDPQNYFIGYSVAASMLLVAALLFIIGWQYYIHVKSDETVVTKCIPVVINAFQSWHQYKQNQRSIEKEHTNSIPPNLIRIPSNSLTEEEKLITIDERPSTFLDFAKAPNGGKFQGRIVDDVKSLRSAIIIFSLLIPYWLTYNQISATFPSQGQHMKWSQDKKYIVPWMTLGDPVIVIIGIIILYTFASKYLKDRNRAPIIATKFVIGMCFACITMCIAGGLEILRQQSCPEDQEDSTLPIYYQIPQGIGIGFSQLFAMVASCEYAYFAAPRSAQSLFMSLYFCSIGIASFIGAAYVYLFPTSSFKLDFRCNSDPKWHWSFYTYFFILAGLQFIFIIIFIVCHKIFRIVKLNPQHMGERMFVQ